MKYKITLEVETDKKREIIEPAIRYTLGKHMNIIKLKVEEIK